MSKHLIVVFIGLILIGLPSYAEDVVLRHSFAGNISFELTGNTLRNSNNTCFPIAGGASTGNISLPNSASIEAAYLYWSGSGASDNNVTFNGNPIAADVTYIEIAAETPFFSAKADVTRYIINNSDSYTVKDLTFDGSNTYCANARAYGGWALAVIYEDVGEPLRVINIFDGFKNFRGQSFDLIANNFVVAPNPVKEDGKHAHITWEGDFENSSSLNFYSESLKFEGTDLVDFDNRAGNQFNGYSNVNGITSGVDIDEYEIGNLLTAGKTSVNTTYSSGQDRVFLTAEILSIPNTPVADLSIQQSGPINIKRGNKNTFEFTIKNNGPSTAPENSQFTLTIPQGFSYVTTSVPSWSCLITDNTIDCKYLNDIPASNSSTPLSLSFIIDKTAGTNDSINISGTVTGLLFDNILSNNTELKSYIIKNPNLSTSIKEVIDLNGGNVNSGDTLRYTITINESAGIAVSGISIIDNISSVFSNYRIVSLPSNNSAIDPVDNSSPSLIKIDGIDISANDSQTLVIDATISTGLISGTEINNSFDLISSATETLTINAPTAYVTQAVNPATGNKLLYFHSDRSLNMPDQVMKRNRPKNQDFRNIWRKGYSGTWTMNPTFQSQFEFDGSSINFNLCVQSNQSISVEHTMQIQLLHNSSVIADSDQVKLDIPSKDSPVKQFPYTFQLTQKPIVSAGDTLKLKITNLTGEGGIRVYSLDGTDYCYVSIPAKTVINVDSISAINTATGSAVNEINSGSEISIETVISDPFGSFDITDAELSATDSQGNSVLSNLPMTVIDSDAATKTFSLSYTIPSNIPSGYWKFSVRAKEGEENTIDHSSDFMLLVNQALPNIKLEKSIEVYSDPIHGINSTNNFSKALPGSILTYTIKAENTGLGVAENNSIWISDTIPDKTYMLVKDFDDISGQGPLIEQPINPTSGLFYQFITLDSNSDDIEFSDNNGDDFNYSPTADSEGIDKNITHFRVNPNGIFQAPLAGESTNQFSLKFRVQLQ